MSKAFDSVPFSYLLFKLYHYGIRGKVLSWLEEYFKLRTFTVKVEDSYSSRRQIFSGVPQGSPLGPLLFLIYINDLPEIIPSHTCIKLYADDIKLFTKHENDYKTAELQQALNETKKWLASWKLQMNIDKTCVFYVGKNNKKFHYQLDGMPIKESEEIRDLGIYVDSQLNFRKHLGRIIRTAYFKARQLLRTLRSKSSQIWLNAYKTYVRPCLEYATPIWNPYKKIEIDKIEKVQKFFTRQLYRKCGMKYVQYSERCATLSIETLEIRRNIYDICLLHKICYHQTNLLHTEIFQFSSRPKRKHDYQIIVKQKNNLTKNSFVNRTVMQWNNLPAEIANTSNSVLFKYKLRKYLHEKN